MTRIIAPLGFALLLGLAPLAASQAQTRAPAGQPVPDAASHLPAWTQGSATKGTPSPAVQGREVAKVVNINSASEADLLVSAGREQAARSGDHPASSLQRHERARLSRDHAEKRVTTRSTTASPPSSGRWAGRGGGLAPGVEHEDSGDFGSREGASARRPEHHAGLAKTCRSRALHDVPPRELEHEGAGGIDRIAVILRRCEMPHPPVLQNRFHLRRVGSVQKRKGAPGTVRRGAKCGAVSANAASRSGTCSSTSTLSTTSNAASGKPDAVMSITGIGNSRSRPAASGAYSEPKKRG